MKKIYIVPKSNIVNVATVYVLTASNAGQVHNKKSCRAEACCPFNNKWCRDKQKYVDDWRKAKEYHAASRINQLFFMASNQFDKCPHGYTQLCEQYEQKQR